MRRIRRLKVGVTRQASSADADTPRMRLIGAEIKHALVRVRSKLSDEE